MALSDHNDSASPSIQVVGEDFEARRRWHALPQSLTGRLVLGAVVLTIALVLGIGSVTYFALRRNLYSRLDQQLAADAGPQHADFYFAPRFVYRGERPTGAGAVWAIAFDAQGNTVEPNPGLAAVLSVTPPDRQRLAQRVGSGPTSVTTTDGQRLRVQVVQAGVIHTESGSAPAIVAIGLSSGDAARTLHRLLDLEILVSLSIGIAALIATFFAVRLSLRRLQRVTRLAWEVAGDASPEAGQLSKRVPTADMDLHTEVGQLAYSVNALLSAVETQVIERSNSERRMREFLLDASHELRTPLTSIRGYAELARLHRRGGPGDQSDAPLTENLDRIEAEGIRMSRLVDDLLSLARNDDGAPLNLQLIEIDELLHHVTSNARAAFPDRSIELNAGPGLVVAGDPDQLTRVFTNLVANASLHTRPGGPIRIDAYPQTDIVAVAVTDSGPGLPPEDAARVFDRFWRADKSRTRARGGTGLGMSIVASVVKRHNGTVRFESAVQWGTRVTVALPTPELEPSHAEPISQPA